MIEESASVSHIVVARSKGKMNGFRTTMLLAVLTALFMALGFTIGGSGGALVALLVAGAMNLFTFWNADRIVLAMHGAREVDARQCPEFVGLVAGLARRANLPMPRVFVIDSPHPNAFATGRDPAHAAVAATTGLLGLLDRDEIEGVMAHELGHVRNHDTLIMTMTATIAGAISMLANFGLFFGHDRDRDGGHVLATTLAVLVAPAANMVPIGPVPRFPESPTRWPRRLPSWPMARRIFRTRLPSGTRRRQRSISCRGWRVPATACFRPIPIPATGSLCSSRWRVRWVRGRARRWAGLPHRCRRRAAGPARSIRAGGAESASAFRPPRPFLIL
jgi:hypothetical protein